MKPQDTILRPMARVMVLVPQYGNDGQAFSADRFAAFEAFASKQGGGLTLAGVARGWWWHDNTLYSDENRQYFVTVQPQEASTVAAALGDFVIAEFAQKAAWVEVIPTHVV